MLGVNASTISRRLEALERALGARLFDRTPDGVLPTALAEALAAHAEAMDRAAAGLVLAAEGREAAVEGEVRLTALPGGMEYLVAPALPRLLAAHPRLRLVLDASVAYADLSRREARPRSGDLLVKKLGEGRGAIQASAAYAAELGRLRALGDARWITWGDDLAHLDAARFVAERVPAEAVQVRTSHIGTQLAAARAGVGVLLADRTVGRASGLVEVSLAPGLQRALPQLRSELWLVVHRALRDVPRIAAVWEFLVDEARRLGYAPGP